MVRPLAVQKQANGRENAISHDASCIISDSGSGSVGIGQMTRRKFRVTLNEWPTDNPE